MMIPNGAIYSFDSSNAKYRIQATFEIVLKALHFLLFEFFYTCVKIRPVKRE